jgi:hypothetical protein
MNMVFPFDNNLETENYSYTHTLPNCAVTHKWYVSFGKIKCERCRLDSGKVWPDWPLTNKV